jgi:hypothetical protein
MGSNPVGAKSRTALRRGFFGLNRVHPTQIRHTRRSAASIWPRCHNSRFRICGSWSVKEIPDPSRVRAPGAPLAAASRVELRRRGRDRQSVDARERTLLRQPIGAYRSRIDDPRGQLCLHYAYVGRSGAIGACDRDVIAEFVDLDDVRDDLTLCRFPHNADRKDQRMWQAPRQAQRRRLSRFPRGSIQDQAPTRPDLLPRTSWPAPLTLASFVNSASPNRCA